MEQDVGFFGAADSRPLLFFATVSLLSVRRFHPKSSFFVLLPGAEVGDAKRWTVLLRSWSSNQITPLALPADASQQFRKTIKSSYSSMTFHRHRVPLMLLQRGLRFSVNMDPDVLCVRPWDFSFLHQVHLIAGRPVGAGSRTALWLQERASSARVTLPSHTVLYSKMKKYQRVPSPATPVR